MIETAITLADVVLVSVAAPIFGCRLTAADH
jgi:hypothetical protein